MNLLQLFSRFLVITGFIFVGNVNSMGKFKPSSKELIGVGSFAINEKRLVSCFGEEKILARKQVIISKALVAAAANVMEDFRGNERDAKIIFYSDADNRAKVFYITPDDEQAFIFKGKNFTLNELINEGKPYCYVKGVGYVIVNGGLRLAGDYVSLNEKTIDKKCDEMLPENVAWVAKPIATVALDLAYNYATIAILVGIIDGYNKS